METLNIFMDAQVWGIPYRTWAIFWGLLAASILFKAVVSEWLFGWLRKLAEKTAATWDDKLIDAMKNPASTFVLATGLYCALMTLPLPTTLNSTILLGYKTLGTIFVFWAAFKALGVAAELLEEYGRKKGLALATFAPLFKQIVGVILGIIALIMVLETLGYSVTSIITALGIGGAAIAFASQSTIANLYGSISIALDRPFKVGDVIKIGATEGTVEAIGLRSTQIRTFTKSLVTIPNNTMANEVIDNWTQTSQRRILTSIGVTYGTNQSQLEAIILDIKLLMKSMADELADDPQLVHFEGFGESSLNIQIITYTRTGDIKDFFKIREKFYFEIMGIVAKHGSSFAFPTRTVIMENTK